ncbi:hypothetical protein CWI38_2021p0010, partial [Hamiltosporidium tvaerminnensis]
MLIHCIILEGVGVYKYVRVGLQAEEFRQVTISIKLCPPILNAKKVFSVINQPAISLIHFHIGLDDAVRAVLVKHKIHLRPVCKKRLYLPGTELGRGLHSVDKEISTRRAAILKVENNNKTHLALITGFSNVKYRFVEEFTKKLYNARKNELVSVSDSSRWLKRGNIRPRNEAVFCYIQDRNVFWGADGVGQHCNKSGKTVDHQATRCEKMLCHDYTRRHNEVVRCLHLLLLKRYKFKSIKRIRSHSVKEIIDNEYTEIRV